MPPALQRYLTFAASLKVDLIQRTAPPLFVFRILEGLTAWLLFTHIAFANALHQYGPLAYGFHLPFFLYFAVNSVCYRRYRNRAVSDTLIWVDLVTNFGTMLMASAHTGGLASPVTVLCVIKIVVYGFIFSPRTGMAAVALTIPIVGLFAAGSEFLGFDWVPGQMFPFMLVSGTMFLHFLVLTGAMLGATWLFLQVAEGERQTRVEANRARQAAEREHMAAAVTSSLLSVSEAVSRLTALQEVLSKVVEIGPRILSADNCVIFLWNEERGRYQGAAAAGLETSAANRLLSAVLWPEDLGNLEWVRRLGHCAVINARDMEAYGFPADSVLLAAPLLSGGRFQGIIQFSRAHGPGFTQSDLRLGDGIAGQTAVAIERARLVEQSHRLVRAVNSSDEAVLITDRHGRIVFVNPAYAQMFGVPAEELIGQDALSTGSSFREFWEAVSQAVLSEGTWRGEAAGRRADGSTFPISLHASVIRTGDHQMDGTVAIIEDISAKREIQKQLTRADRLAAAGELAAGVAHEVNNALVGILGQTELARSGASVDDLRAALGTVEAQAHRMAAIVRELLGFARPTPPLRVPVDLCGLTRETLTLMDREFSRHHVSAQTDFAADVPPVQADAKQIQQVLVNLFTNALHAMEGRRDGRLWLRVRGTGNEVEIEVEDNGPGIPPEILPQIFDPFFSTRKEGTGLGLSVSYAIINAHGGELSAQSTPGRGTLFRVRLPQTQGRARRHTAPPPRTALVVDDEDDVADSLTRMLEAEGLSVRRAATGRSALETLETQDFDVILLDVRLPDISGPEIYRALMTRRADLSCRVAFVTGGLWRTDSRTLRGQLPDRPLLSKPCTVEQVREVLHLLREEREAA